MDADDSLMVVAAHPDDEIIGAGIRLSRANSRSAVIVHLTDGSPRNPGDAERAGFPSREAYAGARRLELYSALRLVNIQPEQCFELGATDQESYLHLKELTTKLAGLIERTCPAVVLTHPYEGGHPDHDSTAFCVHEAVSIASDDLRSVWEFTSYHAAPDGSMETGKFLNGSVKGGQVITFSAAERELKRKMVQCFPTQQEVLAAFGLEQECFRQAPSYDFTKPPHAGPLFYERMGWAQGAHWRARAKEASILKCN